MANLNSEAIYLKTLAKMAAWAALAVCGTATPALAQNAVAGTFTLSETPKDWGLSGLAHGS